MEVWLSNIFGGVSASILATIIIAVAKQLHISFKKILEHVNIQDKKGFDYTISYSFRDEKIGDMLRVSNKFFLNAYVFLIPRVFMMLVGVIATSLSHLSFSYSFGGILGVFLVLLCILHLQKHYAKSKKIYEIISNIIVIIALFLLFSIVISAVLIFQDENTSYYIWAVALMIFFICSYFFEIRSKERGHALNCIKYIKKFFIFIVYLWYAAELDDKIIINLFYPWIIICGIEYFYISFRKETLVWYTVNCSNERYMTRNNIIQMKDKKVKFVTENKHVCIMRNEEIDCITYEVGNAKKDRKSNQIRMVYITEDGATHRFDEYVYLGKDWIKFRKKNGSKMQVIIMPTNQIYSIRMCNQEECYEINNEAGSRV